MTLPDWLAGAKLKIELVPSTSWGDNLRSILPKGEWDRLRRDCYVRAGHRCEVCGGVGTKHPVECHETWSYDETDCAQVLTGLIALCPACHRCKHPGHAQSIGLGHLIVPHLMKVNGWTEHQAQTALAFAFMQWEVRSRRQWTVNIEWLRKTT